MITDKAEALVRQNVEDVVDALAAVSDPLPRVMLVGAVCRDALHLEHGHTTALRSTDDLDLALVVDGLDQFDQITSQLTDVWTHLPGGDDLLAAQLTNRALGAWPSGQEAQPRRLEYTAAVRAVITER